jgi:hypothetical protein
MAKPRRQCKKCPWKTSTNPREIPDYDQRLHETLKAETIAAPGDMRGAPRMMACHETREGAELPCVGWLHNQLGPGNNIGLRLRVMYGDLDANYEIVGPQHETFEDTLPP